MKVILRAIDTIRPYENHARRFDAAVAAVAESIRQFGFRQPIVIDADGVIICGHVRFQAAILLGISKVPVHVATDLTPAQVRAYRIADNKLAELADWDDVLLSKELAELKAMDFDLELLGFSERELAELLTGDDDDQDIDDAPAPAREAISSPGALYALGDHKLLVGDATRPNDLARLMGSQRADLLLTDPPYNVAYEGKTADALRIENDAMDDVAFRQFLIDAFAAADSVMREGAVFYIWHADSEGFNFRAACRQTGWKVRQCLVWVKNSMVLGRQDYQWRHEPCLYGWKDGAAHTWLGDRKQTTIAQADALPVIRTSDGYCLAIDGDTYLIRGRNITVENCHGTVLAFDKPSRNADHPTMKPVDLFEYQIRNSVRKGQIVLDPFGGSGTTVIAAERTGRCARVMELDGRYADVIRRRWAELVHGEGCDWQALTPPAD